MFGPFLASSDHFIDNECNKAGVFNEKLNDNYAYWKMYKIVIE